MKNIFFISILSLISCNQSYYILPEVISLNGIDQYHKVENQQDILRNKNSVTLSAWIYPKSITGQDVIAISANDPEVPNTSRAGLRVEADGRLMVLARTVDKQKPKLYTFTKSPKITQLNTWHHIAAVIDYSRNQVIFYYNGKEVERDQTPILFDPNKTPDSPSPLIAIGSEDDGKAPFFHGRITKVLVKPTIYPASAIHKLYLDKPKME